MKNNDKSFLEKVKDPFIQKFDEIKDWIKTNDFEVIKSATITLSGILNGVDVTGIIISLVPEFYNVTKRKIALKHIPDLANQLNERKNQINLNYANSESGKWLFDKTIREIINETNEEKIERLKSFLVSAYIQQDPNEVFIRTCMKRLLDMDIIHLQILTLMENPDKEIREYIRNRLLSQTVAKYNSPESLNVHLKVDKGVFESALEDLRNWKIISTETVRGQYAKDSFGDVKNVISGTQGLITDFGKRFLELIKF